MRNRLNIIAPENTPAVPTAVHEYLKAKLQANYLLEDGIINKLTSEGKSADYILGVLAGCAVALKLLDTMNTIYENNRED